MNKQLEFLIYSTPQEDIKIDVVVKGATISILEMVEKLRLFPFWKQSCSIGGYFHFGNNHSTRRYNK